MSLREQLGFANVQVEDVDELCRFWSRHRHRLAPHLLLPDTEGGWMQCIEDSHARWYVGRIDGAVVSVGVLARISGWPWCSAEVGVGVDPESRGNGIGRSTLGALIDAGFEVGLARVEALVDPRNEASQRMVASAGMIDEGLSRSALELGGKRIDACRWAVVSGAE